MDLKKELQHIQLKKQQITGADSLRKLSGGKSTDKVGKPQVCDLKWSVNSHMVRCYIRLPLRITNTCPNSIKDMADDVAQVCKSLVCILVICLHLQEWSWVFSTLS